MIEKDFLLRLREYIENMEERVECEWGDSRNLEEMIAANAMPDIYAEVLRRLAKVLDPYEELRSASQDPTKQIRLLDMEGPGHHSPWEDAGYSWRFLFPPEEYQIRDKSTTVLDALADFMKKTMGDE